MRWTSTWRRAGRPALVLLIPLLLAGTAHAKSRIYWGGNSFPDRISWANLDGSGGTDLNTTGAPVDGPEGLAIDSAAGRL